MPSFRRNGQVDSIGRREQTVNQVHSLLTWSLVVADTDALSGESASPGLGASLRSAWLGYQLRLDRAMAEAGFGERKFPDSRVLRVCSVDAGSTISAIGRELGVTRQGASK